MSVENGSMVEVAAFSDIDGTMLPGFIIFPVIRTLTDDGIIDARDNEIIQEIFEKHTAGKIDYASFVMGTLEAFNTALKGKKDSHIQGALDEHIAEIELYPWVHPTFEAIQSVGKLTVVSAEPGVITRAVARLFNAEYVSSELDQDANGHYTGAPFRALGSSQKGQAVSQDITASRPRRVAGFGDSAGDVGMLELANPVEDAFCITPDAELRAIATRTGMTIIDDPFVTRSLIQV